MLATLAVIGSTLDPADAVARQAAADTLHRIDIPELPLPQALAELSRQSGVSIGTEGILPPVRTKAVHGRFGAGEALAHMLGKTGFVAQQAGPGAWRIVRSAPQQPDARPAPPRPAQPPPQIDTAQIIVSATKRDSGLMDLPRDIAVVQFNDRQGRDPARGTASIADAIEGMSLGGLGPGRNRMFLRGIADSPFNGASQTTVAVLLDDTRITYAAPDPDLRLVDIERVEILKGPQGSLYGTGTLGGIYRIVTHRADLDTNSFEIESGLSAVGDGSVNGSASAIGNIVLAPERAAMRIVVYGSNEPGWIETGSRSDSNRVRVRGGRAKLEMAPGAGWQLDLTTQVQFLDAADSQYVYQAGSRSRPAQAPEPHDNDLKTASARLAGHIGSVDATFSTGITRHEIMDTIDASVGATSFGLADPALFIEHRNYQVWDNDAHFSGVLGSLKWLAGIAHIEARQRVRRQLTSATSPAMLVIDESYRTAADTALFADATLTISDKFNIETGGRWSHGVIEDRRSSSAMTSAQEFHRTGITPSAALSWRPHEGRLFYLRYGSAFRQGGLDYGTQGQTESYGGDELWTIEAGWRERLSLGGMLDFKGYYTWWDDMQSDMLLPNGLIETRNAGKARIVGAEASLRQPFAGNWTIELGAEVQDAMLVTNDLGIPLEDRRLPVIPAYTLRASLTKKFAVAQRRASIKLSLRYLGPARLSFDPAIDRPMGNLLLTRLEGSIAIGKVDVGLTLDNLLDKRADTFAFGNPFTLRTMRQYTPQRPRTVSLTIASYFR